MKESLSLLPEVTLKVACQKPYLVQQVIYAFCVRGKEKDSVIQNYRLTIFIKNMKRYQ